MIRLKYFDEEKHQKNVVYRLKQLSYSLFQKVVTSTILPSLSLVQKSAIVRRPKQQLLIVRTSAVASMRISPEASAETFSKPRSI